MLDGIWKNGSGKGRKTPKGRQYDDNALKEVEELLSNLELRSDLLIDICIGTGWIWSSIHEAFACIGWIIKDVNGWSLRSCHILRALWCNKGRWKEPPALTIRVCDSLSCELAGSNELKAALENGLDVDQVRVLRAPCMGRCDTAPTLELGHNHIDYATVEKVQAAISSGDTNVKIPDYETLNTYM